MKLKNVVPWILVFLWIIFIFSNSLIIGEVSGNISGHFSAILMSFINKAGFTIDSQLFHHYIRKAAHFSEYAALGFLTVHACAATSAQHKPLLFLLLWILVPACDETIQLFVPDRAGALRDCLIDMSGYITGAFCMYVLLLIIRDLRKRTACFHQ